MGAEELAIGPTEFSPVKFSAGVRPVAPQTLLLLTRLGGVLYLVAGLGVLFASSTGASQFQNLTGLIILSVVNVAIGVGLLVAARVVPIDALRRAYPALVLIFCFYAGIALTFNMHFAGSSWSVGTMVYPLAPIFGFYLLSRLFAVLLVVSVGVEFALLLAIQQHVVAPIAQWVFLMAMLSAASTLVGGLARRADQLAASEHEARQELAAMNQTLLERVQSQVADIEKLGRLRRFLSPQVAEAIMSSGSEAMLAPHRREIAVFFCDLRGFTSFASQVEPEEVLDVLNHYYEVVGNLLHEYQGTVGGFAGDGIMAYFNDPVPCVEPGVAAVEMALRLKDPMNALLRTWQQHGYDLGYGVGISLGHATLGMIGFQGRNDYTPLGTVVNLGARLCAQAASGQILIDQRIRAAISTTFDTQDVGEVNLKGFHKPVPIAAVLGRSTAISE